MAHADDATKAWVSAVPTTNADGNVIDWYCKYRYTLNSFSHTFNKRVIIETPSKAPNTYTQAELLTLMNKDHWDDMFNKKYGVSIASAPVETVDTSFDVSSLSES
tara:strand:+ start:846 stop:1160 length:315 start_codon:yes stop_codon:yes gene_type:complete